MTSEITLLCGTAAAIGIVHTLFGPDHYLPFIMMSRARRWSLARTGLITLLCGVGHVLGSIVLGLIGVAFGIAVTRLETFESFRGSIAAWLLIGFGLAYFVWGIHRAIRNRPHEHVHIHDDSEVHAHKHVHHKEHAHPHGATSRNVTPWILFTIFVFGPCEPLIPILMYPAARSSVSGMIVVAAVFAISTIGTMLGVVMLSAWGVSFARLGTMERYTHALAGATICLSGLAIQFLGL
ncbi:MAG: sulfite exporter TauE/SafE family protein [Kiritimatiellia bacterium]|jgi:sulfite exporter TauE/SafE|nr:sulfite exporter TauE/SafE family protein [Kiritimatiellia bacterium]MDP6630242.1 sulfite exporter TauE/SafE family protein [Kiritimatiellia bacterium]MDP6811511.1 sulfite exporter TauE/SafE family protein [Kiritimatiellia bacterium]MDP7023771.1 sulfite exporter TauE/SafE family protein [Kiritimatiellia bacterium]